MQAGTGEATVRRIWIDLLLYPTHSIPTALAPVLVGMGVAAHEHLLAPLPALVGFLGSWAIHVAGVFTDNHELLRRHPELEEHPELTRAVRDGTLRLGSLRAAIVGCLAVALATAPWLYGIGGPPVLVLGAIGIIASLAYHGPWSYARRGVADPVFFVMFGVVAVVGTCFIQAAAVLGAVEPWEVLGALPKEAWLAGLPCGALVTSVMLIDDLRDREWDLAKGWRTGAVRFGGAFVRREIGALIVFAYAAPLALWNALGAWALLPLVSAPRAFGTLAAIRAAKSAEALRPLTPRMAGLALLHSALLAAAFAVAG